MPVPLHYFVEPLRKQESKGQVHWANTILHRLLVKGVEEVHDHFSIFQ